MPVLPIVVRPMAVGAINGGQNCHHRRVAAGCGALVALRLSPAPD